MELTASKAQARDSSQRAHVAVFTRVASCLHQDWESRPGLTCQHCAQEVLPAVLIGLSKACNPDMISRVEKTSLSCAMQVVPILRAGLVLIEQISTVLPSQVTYHVGLVRDEETLQVILPFNN